MSQESAPAAAPAAPANGTSRWAWAKRVAGGLFFVVVVGLIVQQARQIDWAQVLHTLLSYPPALLAQAGAVAALGLLLYSLFDLLGRRYTGHRVATGQVMGIGLLSYIFNLNLGSLVGGLALRFRLYSRLGVDYAAITRIVGLAMLTNWLGYFFLAGLAFALYPVNLPPNWQVSTEGLHVVGWVLLVAGTAYVGLCARAKRRQWCVRGQALTLPSGRVAALQALLGVGNWLLMSAVIFILMPTSLSYSTVTSTLLLAAVAGLITHVPGNLGVLEAVFIGLLGHRVPAHELLAGLLGYRLLYYLIPLVLATGAYFYAEARSPRPETEGSAQPAADPP